MGAFAECGGYESEGKGKRKQHCTYCQNHGKKTRKTNHKCDLEHCVCLLCKLTRLSRLIMRHQQRLWRHLKDSKRRQQNDAPAAAAAAAKAAGACEPSGEEPPTAADSSGAANGTSSTKRQKCDMCRNHGEIMSKRAHKNTCSYQDCPCELCNLTRKRRYIMKLQQRVRRSQVTSKQQNEVWEYVTQATAELECLGLQEIHQTTEDPNASSLSSDASSSPSPDSSSPTSGVSLSLKPGVSPPNPVTPSAPAETRPTRSKDTASPVSMDMPPLELLPEGSPTRYSPRPPAPPINNVPSPAATSKTRTCCYPSPPPPNPLPPNRSLTNVPLMEIEPVWMNLKREREEVLKQNPSGQRREENLFGHLDFMKDHHHRTMTGRLEPPVPPETSRSFHSTAIPVNFGSSHFPPFKSLGPMIDTSHHPPPPLQKSRADCNLLFQYRSRVWGSLPTEPGIGFVPEEFQQHFYRSFLANNTDLRIQPPAAIIQIPQPQHPLRPRPLAPVRPHTLPVSVECDPVSLLSFPYFLQNQRELYRIPCLRCPQRGPSDFPESLCSYITRCPNL